MQLLLQTSPASDTAAELLQRLQPHGSMSALPDPRHSLRETSRFLLRPSAVEGSTDDVAIARGPPGRHQGPTDAAYATRSESYGPRSGTAVARIGGPATR